MNFDQCSFKNTFSHLCAGTGAEKFMRTPAHADCKIHAVANVF